VWWSWKFKPAAIARMQTAVSIEKLAAELERKLGQQQPDLDFFRAALRRIEGQPARSGRPIGTAFTR